MSKVRAIQCDRCKAFVQDDDDRPVLRMLRQRRMMNHYDLCKPCIDSFLLWVVERRPIEA